MIIEKKVIFVHAAIPTVETREPRKKNWKKYKILRSNDQDQFVEKILHKPQNWCIRQNNKRDETIFCED